MNRLKSYTNTKNELSLVNLRLNLIEKNKTSLENEKENLNDIQNELSTTLASMEESIKNLNGIEESLYYEIVINGTNVTKAVDKISFKYDKDPSTIWKNYYPNVKKEIEKLKKF